MLAELAVANAAFGVIKTAIGNGRDLAAVGKQIGDWIGAEEKLKTQTEADKNSIFNKFMGKDTNDFESFLALDQIKEQRRQLESHMRLYGRPGLFDDWVLYQAEARKSRRAAAKQRVKDREELQENLMILGVLVFLVCILIGIFYYLYTQ
jgi:hypothetical protein